ncbi:GNAT family N-acetyltransferase [Lentzea tibetensis]|uniref:GNAT family N-acetyltransferase n=2 Tax=Lentzea tibetensis TaxID=2591470 RepID=A0A563EMI1_9PSEU|nr:GNAT family N-acetyltransferase [Lentzea tibetensis]
MQTSRELHDNDNKAVLRSKLGQPIGLLAVDDGTPVGWVAVAPRAAYSRLAKSKITAPVEPDISDVWSVTCFFVHRTGRRKGVTKTLLNAAVEYAKERGARAVEGYPVDTGGKKAQPGDLYHGTLSVFLDAGFSLVERRGTKRALVSRAC